MNFAIKVLKITQVLGWLITLLETFKLAATPFLTWKITHKIMWEQIYILRRIFSRWINKFRGLVHNRQRYATQQRTISRFQARVTRRLWESAIKRGGNWNSVQSAWLFYVLITATIGVGDKGTRNSKTIGSHGEKRGTTPPALNNEARRCPARFSKGKNEGNSCTRATAPIVQNPRAIHMYQEYIY